VQYLIIIGIIVAVLVVALWGGESGEPDPEQLSRVGASSVKQELEERVDELSDEEVLELWKELRTDMKRRERRGVIFSERLKLEAEQENRQLEGFDRELQEELVTLEESSNE